ncbi:MAG: hypothetical protein N2323_04230 [candidate division WOR-3 bacterium]|nr:hypothetical protein [candidate division WOR-3 bacterium]MCX7837150.1 hypothetical protein [candidate division WOR-3 bacterium]MDW8114347.1 hypothetical protein [candidate division WOR-3 bacterium]
MKKNFGGAGYDEGRDIKEYFGGGYIIVGSTSFFGQGFLEVYLIRTGENDKTLWTRIFWRIY